MRASLPLFLGSFLLLSACADDGSDHVTPVDQCVGGSDQALLAPELVDGGLGISATLADIVQTCAQSSCASQIVNGTEAEAEACMAACYDGTAIAGLSTGCDHCLTDWALCGAENCPNVCLGTDPALCESCMIENCVAERDACFGI